MHALFQLLRWFSIGSCFNPINVVIDYLLRAKKSSVLEF